MAVDYRLHFYLFAAALAGGVFLGFLYDLFRISRMFFLKNRVVIFFQDLIFSALCTVVLVLIFYNYSFGLLRAYAFISAIGGFSLYYFTVGKLTRKICEMVYAFVSPRLRKAARAIHSVYDGSKKQMRTRFLRRRYIKAAKNGFGLLKKRC